MAEAVALRRAGHPDASARCFDQALERDPGQPGALVSYAMLLLEVGDLQRAIDLGRRAILADPSRLSAHHVLAELSGFAGCEAAK